jgi:hypothetical protein
MRSIFLSWRPSFIAVHHAAFAPKVALRAAMVLVAATVAVGCGSLSEEGPNALELGAHSEAVERSAQPLALDARSEPEEETFRTAPADDYTLFEADPVRPVTVLDKSGLVVVVNTFDDSLELFEPAGAAVRRCGAVKVGMRPVAAATLRESRNSAELWVVNHLSDSVNVVELDTRTCAGEVVDTLYTGDEPRDIVVAKTSSGQRRVFVAAAHRGQHHPESNARNGADLTTPAADKAAPGLADVFVFDPKDRTARPTVVNLFTETPRALAAGDGVVYAAGFRTGNRTTVVHAERAAQRGVDSLSQLLARDASGAFIEHDGQLVLARGARGRRIEGGMPAVLGHGRCVPDPRPELRDRFIQQVCVATDRDHRVRRVYVEREGTANDSCRCTSGDGTLQPTTAVIVKFFDDPTVCGRDFHTFPDGSRGCWLDADPAGVRTPAEHGSQLDSPMAWNGDVKLSLPDTDVFAIRVDDLRVMRDFSGVGTVLFSMAVQPGTGKLFVTNTEAHNLTRFEGNGESSSSTVQGHLHESRVTVIDPGSGSVRPVHLNDHIDYSRCCERSERESDNAFAFPTSGVFSADGATFYFAALGSDSIGVVESSALGSGFRNLTARRKNRLKAIRLGATVEEPTGPVAVELDRRRHRLYVTTHFTSELVVIDTNDLAITGRVALATPEPESIRAGRSVFYDARRTSSHGDSACASCHVFGDFDGLSWDLGDPDAASVNNPGPYVLPSELISLRLIAADPFAEDLLAKPNEPDFRSNKGPMSTQTLRGLANHGAMHWRGDRTRNFQGETGRQPNFGSLDENNSFNEFDIAIQGLNGNDHPLEPEDLQAFTNFALQLTLPPNPIRALDNSLSPSQARARASYFGCSSLSDEQLEQRECIAFDGALVAIDAETQSCRCAKNPLVSLLRSLPQAVALGSLLQAAFAGEGQSAAFDAAAADLQGLGASDAARATTSLELLKSSRSALSAADLALDERGLIPLDAALALSGTSGAILQLFAISSSAGTETGQALANILLDAIAEAAAGAPGFDTPEALGAALEGAFGLSNLAVRAVVDEAARDTGDFHNLLQGCRLTDPEPECRLRVTDSFETCNGCHTLDAKGNAELDVYRPGFFGTSGEYSFENVSQILKVPHLRNQYQKAGMFGMPLVEFVLPESMLGPARGGFFAADNAHMGAQVRGYGFMHDGAVDTLHRFHGAAVFAKRPRGALVPEDPGNPDGFDAVLPAAGDRSACVQQFRTAPPRALDVVTDPATRSLLELCLAQSPIPSGCFLDPSDGECQAALEALGEDFATTFENSIRPACFQLGSMLEQGSPEGRCAPEGLKDRAEMVDFMLAFDSNLMPMVGQQLTLHDDRFDHPLLAPMLRAAEHGHCDIALRRKNRGYLVTQPDAKNPRRTRIVDGAGRGAALDRLRSAKNPVTLTCYPPHPSQAEARRNAFGQ